MQVLLIGGAFSGVHIEWPEESARQVVTGEDGVQWIYEIRDTEAQNEAMVTGSVAPALR